MNAYFTPLYGYRLACELDRRITKRGKPKTIISDTGTELTSMAILKWCQQTHIERHYIIHSRGPLYANERKLGLISLNIMQPPKRVGQYDKKAL